MRYIFYYLLRFRVQTIGADDAISTFSRTAITSCVIISVMININIYMTTQAQMRAPLKRFLIRLMCTVQFTEMTFSPTSQPNEPRKNIVCTIIRSIYHTSRCFRSIIRWSEEKNVPVRFVVRFVKGRLFLIINRFNATEAPCIRNIPVII